MHQRGKVAQQIDAHIRLVVDDPERYWRALAFDDPQFEIRIGLTPTFSRSRIWNRLFGILIINSSVAVRRASSF